MTAIGFLCILFGMGVAWYDDLDDVHSTLLTAAFYLFWFGIVLLLAGITTWLWQVMP